MVGLVSTVEDRLESDHLLPSALPSGIQYCRNDFGSAHTSLHIRLGCDSSPVAETLKLQIFTSLEFRVVLQHRTGKRPRFHSGLIDWVAN
ncbi:Red chlorophyll catabolite reductase, chloroplastic [Linum grandiflorum]